MFTAHVVHMFFFFIHNLSYSGKTYSKSFYQYIPFRKKCNLGGLLKLINPDLPSNQNDINDKTATTKGTGGIKQDLHVYATACNE